MLFLAGAALLVIGMGFFTLGADMSMMEIGQQLGRNMVKSKKLPVIVFFCFLIGIIITIAEPDLQVLAAQTPVPAAPFLAFNWVLCFGISAGRHGPQRIFSSGL